MRILLLLLCVAIGINACRNKNNIPAGILQKSQMQSVLWDVMQAEAFSNSFIKKVPSNNSIDEDARLQKQIFSIHNISKEDFDKSYNYYVSHSDIMLALLDSMVEQQNRDEREKLTKRNKAIADSLKMKQLKDKNLLLQKKTNTQDSTRLKKLSNKASFIKPKATSIKQAARI
jgi:hypothetical protein